MDLIRLTKVLKALSDPTRLEIVALLSFRPHCVCELVNIIGFSQPTISRHLQVLTDARITSFEKSKFFIIYKLSPKDEFTYKILDTLLEELKKQGLYDEIISKTTPDSQFLFQSLKTHTLKEGGNA
jgi:ArsR family transcriptional regulator